MTRPWPPHEPDPDRCTCPPHEINPECWQHGEPEPPEPDHRQLKLELEQPMWEGNLPEGF